MASEVEMGMGVDCAGGWMNRYSGSCWHRVTGDIGDFSPATTTVSPSEFALTMCIKRQYAGSVTCVANRKKKM